MNCRSVTFLLIYLFLQQNEFAEGSENSACDEWSPCISIYECETYQSAEVVRQRRPRPCGFTGNTPLVCCPLDLLPTPEPSTIPTKPTGLPTPSPSSTKTLTPAQRKKLLQLLPVYCGDPSRTLFASVPTGTESLPPCTNPDPFECPHFVIGGRPAEEGKWPWMVLLGKWLPTEKPQLGDWFCGGTLITDRHVLTAAHCVRSEQRHAIGARLGDYDLSTTSDVAHQDRIVANITRHERYQGAQNDLALLELDRPYEPSDVILPICLPPAGADPAGRPVQLAGWGRLEFGGDVPDVLQEATLVVSDVRDCERTYSQIEQFAARFHGGFQGTKICALSRDGEPRDACRGDSGGPLMARRRNSDLYELVGVVSTGIGCGNPKYPGIYTKVSAYVDWILEHIA